MKKKTKLNFKEWTQKLKTVWSLKTEKDHEIFAKLMYSLKGTENIAFAEKLIDAVRVKHDHGAYESLYNAIWAYPKNIVGQLLAKRLPELQKRMGKYDQVSMFYIPIVKQGIAQKAFIEESKKWNPSEKRTALAAIKKWAVDFEDWDKVLEKLGSPAKKSNEDPIPEEWPLKWKNRLAKGRKDGGEYCISDLVWHGGKKQWKEDLDFVIELLALNHGKHWRQIDNMTNPIYGYAYNFLYDVFIKKLKALPPIKRNKIAENIKKISKRKHSELMDDLKKS